MPELCLVGYGSFIDPENVKGGFRYSSQELVCIGEHQRFIGAVDLAKGGGILNDEGELVKREVGVCTIEPSESHRFVATLYRGIPKEDMDAHDYRERSSHRFSSLTIRPRYISRLDGSSLTVDGEVRAYHADADAVIDGRQVRVVRDDIMPDSVHVEKCMAAAAVHGEDILKMFADTTFFADRRTPLTYGDLYTMAMDIYGEHLAGQSGLPVRDVLERLMLGILHS